MNCKFKFHLRAAIHRGAAGPVGSAEVGGPTGVPGGAPPADGIRFTVLRIPRVRARKPSSLALRASGRELGRPASRVQIEKRCTEGSVGLRASLPTIIFPKGKN